MVRASSRRPGLGTVLVGCLLLFAWSAAAGDLGTIRAGVLRFGTVSWELDVVKHHRLDAKEGFTLEVTAFASNDAANVAFLGDAVDVIVEDWLWVSRQRAEGVLVSFIPYSSNVGFVVARPDRGIRALPDLSGKTLGVAGGALDKSWLILQALALRDHGLDLAKAAKIVYGAPPLLSEKLKQGELDAALVYWHFGARLEAQGYPKVVGVAEAQEALGVPASTPQLGYIFKESWAKAAPERIAAFARASRAAKAIMKTSDAEWERLRPLTRAEDDATLRMLRDRYREGIVERWGDAERQAAAELYAILAELGGEALVGKSKTLVDGTFWPLVRY
ncbi:MAG: ABC transporter substrate-binding protein [Geminicoccaceae bacterium]|nr:ABC transporter substrate-binding protein [Geminicoccaceae bacterium]MDW8340006.1 ABC transporter substrate-binding protein [Geminicoccaceae bacterium]